LNPHREQPRPSVPTVECDHSRVEDMGGGTAPRDTSSLPPRPPMRRPGWRPLRPMGGITREDLALDDDQIGRRRAWRRGVAGKKDRTGESGRAARFSGLTRISAGAAAARRPGTAARARSPAAPPPSSRPAAPPPARRALAPGRGGARRGRRRTTRALVRVGARRDDGVRVSRARLIQNTAAGSSSKGSSEISRRCEPVGVVQDSAPIASYSARSSGVSRAASSLSVSTIRLTFRRATSHRRARRFVGFRWLAPPPVESS